MLERSAAHRAHRSRRRRPAGDESFDAALRRLARVQSDAVRADAGRGDGWSPDEKVAPDDPLTPAYDRPEAPADGSGRRWRRLRDALVDRVPVSLRGAVLAGTARAIGALVAVLALAVLATAILVWLTRPHTTTLPVTSTGGAAVAGVGDATPAASGFPVAGASAGSGSAAGPAPGSTAAGYAGGAGAPSPTASVVVHVAGAVHRPGLVTLPAGSRVADAVAAAGGGTRTAQLASVNLARLLVDGEQLVVLRRGQVGVPSAAPAGRAAAGPPGSGASAGTGAGVPVDLNTATLAQLDGLPGIGPVLAQRILDWRTQHGRFGSVDELSEVSGIGERTLADLRPAVRV